MKVVITGGEGFIGKALAAALSKRGAEVIIIDRKKGIEAKDFSIPFRISTRPTVCIICPPRHRYSILTMRKSCTITSKHSWPCVMPASVPA